MISLALRSYSRVVSSMLLVYVISFGIIFPFLLWNRPFSVYYKDDDSQAKERIRQRNQERFLSASKRFELYKEHSYSFNYQRLQSGNLYLLITIVTVSRVVENERLEYLIQSIISSHQELVENESIRAALLVCNVDRYPMNHKEAASLSQYFPTIVKNQSDILKDLYEKEKDDYVYCLEQSRLFNPQYVLMVEDDATPYSSMLPYLKYILDRKVTTMYRQGERVNRTKPWLALKLYYPETWMGFGFETLPLLQLVGLACVFASLFAFASWVWFMLTHAHFNVTVIYVVMAFGALYGVLVAYGVGRQNLFELCRLHPMFFHIYRAPGCCTPATLFPLHQLQGLIDYLDRIRCKSDFGLDLAIDAFAEKSHLTIYQVAPNLFRHIGFFSTLTSAKKRYEEFLI